MNVFAAPMTTYRRWFVRIMLIGFALRLIWAVAVPVHPVSDGSVYDELATNLATLGSYAWGPGRPTLYWPVGTAFVYSILYRIIGHVYWPIVALNLVLGMMTLGLVMALARRWMDERIALGAGAIYALWPSQIQFTTILASELLFNGLVLAALFFALETRMASAVVRGLATGIVVAAAAYVRPQALVFPALLLVGLVWRRRGAIPQAVVLAIASTAAIACCIAPWALRNERLFDRPVLISANGGVNLWMGNNPVAKGTYMNPPSNLASLDEVTRDEVLGDRAADYIRAHPLKFAEGILIKFVKTHDRETIGVNWNQIGLRQSLTVAGLWTLKLVSTLYWYVMLVFAVYGILLIARREGWWTAANPTILFWTYFAAVHSITVAQDRYHFPSIPFIAMLAAAGLLSFATHVRTRRSSKRQEFADRNIIEPMVRIANVRPA